MSTTTDQDKLNAAVENTSSSEWAVDADRAIQGTTAEHATAFAEGRVLSQEDSAVDTGAKSQADVERNLPTPGPKVPGAWTDAPASGAQQVLSDAQTALGNVGSAAYNAIPDSIKQTLSNEPGTKSVSQQASETASTAQGTASDATTSAAQTVSAAGTTIAGTASAVATGVYNTLFGSSDAQPDRNAEVMPAYEPNTLPSQELHGQQPNQGPMGGAGALPGSVHETGVAILPDEKGGVDKPVTDIPTQSTVSHDTTVSDKVADAGIAAGAGISAAAGAAATTGQQVYDSAASTAQDAYRSTAEAVTGVPGAPKTLSNETGETRPFHETRTLPTQDKQGQLPLTGPMDGVGALPGSEKEEGVALLPDEKANPEPLYTADQSFQAAETNTPDPYGQKANKSDVADDTTSASTGSASKKPGFLDKVKGQAKIISGKISGNDDKVAEGQAIKSGQP